MWKKHRDFGAKKTQGQKKEKIRCFQIKAKFNFNLWVILVLRKL